jgi:uncharacterized protein (DUF885 family)
MSENMANFNIAYKHFDDLCGSYYHAWFRYHPEEAVESGINDYANLLRSYKDDDIGALISLNQKMLSAMDEINIDDLEEVRQMDYRIMQGAIRIELHDLEENDWRYRNPIDYVPVNAIYQLLIHPGENVHQAMKHRLEKIPEYLRGAKVLLSQHPERVVRQWAQTARDIAFAGTDFVRNLERHPLITEKFTNPARLQPLIDAAAIALNDFAGYLESDIMPKAQGKFASGVYRFDRLINERHFLETDAQSILNFGEKLAEDTRKKLLDLSEKICGEADINRALQEIRKQHPEASDLLNSYRQQMQTAHAWLADADIITMPEKQSLKVRQTPEFLRCIIPFAAYEPPLPQDRDQHGLYYVTTTSSENLLAEHNYFSIDLTSVHEAFPGHHLQFVLANHYNNTNVTRILHTSASMYEGWALYCEQLAFEQGLFNKNEHRFILLRDRLWRALRIIIDVKMHTGQCGFHDAVSLLVNNLGFDVSQAQSEISWYSHSATTPLCYAIGREIILKTREIVMRQDSDLTEKEKLKDFHDKLLSQGSIALPLVIKSVFGESVWREVHDEIFLMTKTES